MQKLTDPQFFSPSAHGYIGKQILGFATGSPLHGLLMNVALPHASFFGYLVAFGEIAIGLGTFFGFLFRPAAFFGLLISLLFFLSATWRVYPYFYGADIVFVFCWITMLLAGPMHTGFATLDEFLFTRLLFRLSVSEKKRYAPVVALIIGVTEKPASPATDSAQAKPVQSGGKRSQQQRGRYSAAQYAKESRRNFVWGLVTGGGAMFALAWLWNLTHTGTTTTTVGSSPSSSGAAATTTAGGTTGAASAGSTIAQVSQVPNNSSVNFTLASNGDPGILVRLNNGQFVAYDAVCTHAGCPVDYDPGSQLLVCPCHGAQFDPSKSAAVVGGPAPTPLTNVPINVNNSTGNITLS